MPNVAGGLAVLRQSTVQLKMTGMEGLPCTNKQLTQLTAQKNAYIVYI